MRLHRDDSDEEDQNLEEGFAKFRNDNTQQRELKRLQKNNDKKTRLKSVRKEKDKKKKKMTEGDEELSLASAYNTDSNVSDNDADQDPVYQEDSEDDDKNVGKKRYNPFAADDEDKKESSEDNKKLKQQFNPMDNEDESSEEYIDDNKEEGNNLENKMKEERLNQG